MKKAIILGLIVTTLTIGGCKKEYFNQNNVHTQVQIIKSNQSLNQIECKKISYDALVELVKQKGGILEINISTTQVGKEKSTGLLHYGYGFAWAKKMQGNLEGKICVNLSTTQVGKEKSTGLLHYGYGFAWAKKMQGDIGGNKFELTTIKVKKSKEKGFPHYGYGFSNVEKMTGKLGNLIDVNYKCNKIGKEKSTGLLHYGYGFAWAKEGKLTLSLK